MTPLTPAEVKAKELQFRNDIKLFCVELAKKYNKKINNVEVTRCKS